MMIPKRPMLKPRDTSPLPRPLLGPAADQPAEPPRVPGADGQRVWAAGARVAAARVVECPGPGGGATGQSRWRRSRRRFPAKAKRCIFLFMTGGPSQMDLFDPKPLLNRLDGQPLPPSFGKIHSQFLESDPLCLGSHRKWGKYGQSGLDMSDLVPHLHRHADDIALVRSCVADSVIHAPAMYQMMTGRVLMGHPSLGSWVIYGLGSESENLPAYVVMTQPEGTPEGGAPCWGAGFLPAHYQGTLLRSGPAPIVNLRAARRSSRSPSSAGCIDLVRAMNEQDLDPADTELSARISTYELAFRMQSAAPEAVDLSTESEATKAMYGLDDHRTVEFGTRCLLARRLIERGVRFVQLYSGGGPGGRCSGTPTTTSTPTTRRCAG